MARINLEKVRQVAEVIKKLPEDFQPLNFYSYPTPDGEVVAKEMYPSLDHPNAVDFFFFVCLQNYGFWLANETVYTEPLIGMLDGKERKGSDLLWRICLKRLKEHPNSLNPFFLRGFSDQSFEKLFSDDNGVIPFRDLRRRIVTARKYAKWFCDPYQGGTQPAEMVARANASAQPLGRFLEFMRSVPGFDKDPLEKRQMLLAMALANRPEEFLKVTDPGNWMPIVDYHCMRVCLRSGLVRLNKKERELSEGRVWAPSEMEAKIREICFQIMREVERLSGRTHAVVDLAFFKARRYCPEMTEPNCTKCILQDICAQDTDLFQLVLDTTNY